MDTSFSRIEHLNIQKLLKYDNISTNIPLLESYNIVHFKSRIRFEKSNNSYLSFLHKIFHLSTSHLMLEHPLINFIFGK